jgi:superoxide dismutase, Fe-Mn family
MKFELTQLPYAADALEPYMSRHTLHFHHDKHHQGYLDKVRAGLDASKHELPLEDIIRDAEGAGESKLFNSAAQVWNHDFFWFCLSPEKPSLNDRGLQELLDKSFGGLDQFTEKFATVAADEFGSGWAWLVYSPGSDRLEVLSTTDAKTPLTSDQVPLLTLDVWEHAYYLDYKHDRPGYISAFLEHLINWDFAAENLKRARSRG